MIRTCSDLRRILPHHVEEMAAEKSTLWEPGRTLRIEFAGGRLADRKSVMKAAQEWGLWANVRVLNVYGGPSELRCSFLPGGSWSYIGKEVLTISADQPTMNMGWIDDYARDLHEFGHSLGLIHEHQSPAAGIPWNKPAAYQFYGGSPNYWTRSVVDEQVFNRYSQGTITNTVWDGNSIMEYPIPPALVLDPAYAVGWNQRLSVRDKSFIAQLYPNAR